MASILEEPLARALASIPHRPPWRLIDRLLLVEEGRVVGEKRLTAGDPLVGQALGGLLCIEALAQTAACLMGARKGGAHLGYLVAAQGWKFPATARAGETLQLEARLVAELGSLHRFEGRARVGDREVAAGTMTFAVADGEPPPGA